MEDPQHALADFKLTKIDSNNVPINKYPTSYVDVRLEESYKNAYGLDCDLTFWAVQFNEIVRENSQGAF